jgi:mycothiol synthase
MGGLFEFGVACPGHRHPKETEPNNHAMSENPHQPQLHMFRPSLTQLPPLVLPEGYTLRAYAPGMGEAWGRIISESFNEPPTKFTFEKTMEKDAFFLPERVFFIVHEGEAVATAAAYCWPHVMPAAGMIHFVGALKGHTGKRLGYWVSLAAMRRMVVDGFDTAWLSTDDFRLPAIKTYLNLGFQPLLVHGNQPERWRAVFRNLGDESLSDKFKGILEGPLYKAPGKKEEEAQS